jgi:hypothetical protein
MSQLGLECGRSGEATVVSSLSNAATVESEVSPFGIYRRGIEHVQWLHSGTSPRRLYDDLLNLVERDLIVGVGHKASLCGGCGIGLLLGLFKRPVVLKVTGDPRCPKRVAPDFCLDGRGLVRRWIMRHMSAEPIRLSLSFRPSRRAERNSGPSGSAEIPAAASTRRCVAPTCNGPACGAACRLFRAGGATSVWPGTY